MLGIGAGQGIDHVGRENTAVVREQVRPLGGREVIQNDKTVAIVIGDDEVASGLVEMTFEQELVVGDDDGVGRGQRIDDLPFGQG